MNLSSSHFNLNETGIIPNVLSMIFNTMSESNLSIPSPIKCLQCPAILNWSQPTPGSSWTCLFCKHNNQMKDAHVLPTTVYVNRTYQTVFLLEKCNYTPEPKYIIFCMDTSGSMSTTLPVSVKICNYLKDMLINLILNFLFID